MTETQIIRSFFESGKELYCSFQSIQLPTSSIQTRALSYLTKTQIEWGKNHTPRIKRSYMANTLAVRQSSLSGAIMELKKKGYIVTVGQPDKDCFGGTIFQIPEEILKRVQADPYFQHFMLKTTTDIPIPEQFCFQLNTREDSCHNAISTTSFDSKCAMWWEEILSEERRWDIIRKAFSDHTGNLLP